MEIGIDLQDTGAFKSFKKNRKFYQKIFTEREIAYCLKRKDYKTCFCGKFCAKEALIKVFDTKIAFKDIEILNSPSGKPQTFINKSFKENLRVSISHTGTSCVGVAVRL